MLGRVVAIRSEADPQRLKHFTPDQQRIWDEWQRRQANAMTQKEFEREMKKLERDILAGCR